MADDLLIPLVGIDIGNHRTRRQLQTTDANLILVQASGKTLKTALIYFLAGGDRHETRPIFNFAITADRQSSAAREANLLNLFNSVCSLGLQPWPNNSSTIISADRFTPLAVLA